jgi:hypothetical protein
MPPKIQGKGRTVAEPSFAQNTLHAFTDKENRSVVTAIGMFAVSTLAQTSGLSEDSEDGLGWSRCYMKTDMMTIKFDIAGS